MSAAPEADVVRLSLPADPDLAPVLVTAARVLAIRSGLSGRDLDSTLEAVSALFVDVATSEDPTDAASAELHCSPAGGPIRLTVRRGDVERSLELGG